MSTKAPVRKLPALTPLGQKRSRMSREGPEKRHDRSHRETSPSTFEKAKTGRKDLPFEEIEKRRDKEKKGRKTEAQAGSYEEAHRRKKTLIL